MTKHPDDRLAALSSLAHLLDRAFRVPGTSWRFGLDSIIGLVPGAGDVLGSLAGTYSLWTARQLGAPASIQMRMLLNLAIDAVVGAVPLAGDLFDFAFKAHSRNLALLERWLATPHTTRRSSSFVLIFAVLVLLAIVGGAVWLAIVSVSWLAALLRS